MDAPIRYKVVGYDCGMEPAQDGAYVSFAEHERVVAEMEAQRDRAFELADEAQAAAIRAQDRWAEARNKALEDAAACCENEADKCDDAVKWGGERRYIQNCMAASFAMRNRAAAIRAMKGDAT